MSQQNNTNLNTPSSLLQNYARYDVEFATGEGAYLTDTNGKQYLDFLSGIAVTGFGHSHPLLMNTLQQQINKVWHTSNLFTLSGQEKLAAHLTARSGLDKVFFCNSGTEAVEASIKFARKWGKGRYEIIACNGSFHGRTMGSLSATGQPKFWEGFLPLTPGFKFVDFNNIQAVKEAITPETVAILIEPIQGESGIIVPDPNYLSELRTICNENNLLLILDEIQSGIGRTGKFFAYQHSDILPDIVTAAKGIANGIPLGCVICTEQVALGMTPGTHGSTFGGNPLAVAVANSVMELLTEETLANITSKGNQIIKTILSTRNKNIVEVRGKGLMIGVEFTENTNAKEIAKTLLNNGLVTGTSGSTVIRLLPPFILTEKEIEEFKNKWTKTISNG